jgi:hypothetical protein
MDNSDEIKKPKAIRSFFFRSMTESGEYAKIAVISMDNGVVHIQKRVLSSLDKEKTEASGFKTLCTKFGKNLIQQIVSFKYGTIANILNEHNRSLVKNNVKREDILH